MSDYIPIAGVSIVPVGSSAGRRNPLYPIPSPPPNVKDGVIEITMTGPYDRNLGKVHFAFELFNDDPADQKAIENGATIPAVVFSHKLDSDDLSDDLPNSTGKLGYFDKASRTVNLILGNFPKLDPGLATPTFAVVTVYEERGCGTGRWMSMGAWDSTKGLPPTAIEQALKAELAMVISELISLGVAIEEIEREIAPILELIHERRRDEKPE